MSEEIKKKFQECSLKARTLHITLPSGFEFDFILPTTGRFLRLLKEGTTVENVMSLLQEGLPDGLNLDDFAITDLVYLREVIGDFFDKVVGGKFQSGSENTQET